MEDDGPHAAPRLLALDIARMASGGVCMMADQDTPASPPPARTEALASEGSTHLSAEALSIIRGEVSVERKKLMYSNSLRRRSIEVDVQ